MILPWSKKLTVSSTAEATIIVACLFATAVVTSRISRHHAIISTPTTTTSAIAIAIVLIMGTTKIWRLWHKHNNASKHSNTNNESEKQKPLPPMAPYGFLQTIHHLTGPDLPWFCLRIARTPSIGPIFRIQTHPFNWGPPAVVTADAKLAQSVLRESTSYKHRAIYGIFEKVGGPSIFSSEGGRWHHVRKAVAPAFSSKQVARMNSIISKQIRQWMEEDFVPNYVETGKPFDPSDELLRQMLKGISLAGFEYDISNEEIDMVLLELSIAFREISFQASNPLRETFSRFHRAGRRMMLSSARSRDFAHSVLDHYRKQKHPQEGTTIISLIAQNDNYESDDDRCSDIMAFYIAGHDTTAYTLAWILLELSRKENSMEQTRLRMALRQASMQQNSDSDRIYIPELKRVVKEGMRLHPVVPNINRTLAKDFVTEDYFIPKGSHVAIATLSIHRNAECFKEPDVFRPSRWEDPSEQEALMVAAYLPFALGRRNCVGQSLAYAEIYNVLAILLVDYELRVVDEGKVDFFVTLKPLGVKLIATKVQ